MCVQWQSREVYLKSHKLNTCHWGLTHSSRAIFACGVAKEVKSSGYPPWHWYYNNEQEISSRHTRFGLGKRNFFHSIGSSHLVYCLP